MILSAVTHGVCTEAGHFTPRLDQIRIRTTYLAHMIALGLPGQ